MNYVFEFLLDTSSKFIFIFGFHFLFVAVSVVLVLCLAVSAKFSKLFSLRECFCFAFHFCDNFD